MMKTGRVIMSFFKAFYYAGRGFAKACKQRNFRFHLCAMVFVFIFAALFYSFTPEKWAILMLTCSAVLSLEAVNTSIENLADSVTEKYNERIRAAKDCAAGAVLISAVFAVIIGIILFWNIDKFTLIILYFSEPVRLSALILSLALAWGFIFLPKNG